MKATDYLRFSIFFSIILSCQIVLLWILGHLFLNPNSTFLVSEPNQIISGIEIILILISIVFVLGIFFRMFKMFIRDFKIFLEERY